MSLSSLDFSSLTSLSISSIWALNHVPLCEHLELLLRLLMFPLPVCSAPLARLIILVPHLPVFLVLAQVLGLDLKTLKSINSELLRDDGNNDGDSLSFLQCYFGLGFLPM